MSQHPPTHAHPGAAPRGRTAAAARYDLVVLGAGPAGLGAAWWAAQAGHRVVLVEREQRVGGAAGSITVAGQRVDLGSHRLHPAADPDVLAALRELLGTDLQTRPRRGRIRVAGRWVAFPLRAADVVARVPPTVSVAALRDALTAPLRRPGDDSYAEVLRAGLGSAICRHVYFPYAEKLWGLPPQHLAGEQARRRVGASSPARLAARLLPGTARRATFLYPRRGFGQLWECMAEAAVAAGAEIRLGSAVRRLALRADVAEVDLAGGATVHGRRVWSTLPLPVLVRLVDPPPPAAVRQAAGHLRTRAMVLVYLVLERDRFTAFDAHYLPATSTPVSRLSEPKNYRDGDDPQGRTVLCAELPCDVGDDVWGADDATLGAMVATTLRRNDLPDPGGYGVHVERLARAYPVYTRDYMEHFGLLDAWAATQPRLLTFGRQGLFAHDNSHHALAMARAAVAALAPDGRFDEDGWAVARRGFLEHVVED